MVMCGSKQSNMKLRGFQEKVKCQLQLFGILQSITKKVVQVESFIFASTRPEEMEFIF